MRFLIPVLVMIFLAGCASRPFSYYHPQNQPPEISSLVEKAREIEKQDFENIKLETLAENQASSHHLVIVREEEPLHYHADHDGWAFLLKGEADFLLGEAWFKMRPGSSVYIPRGMKHKVVRTGKEALAAFVVFTPPFDGKDTVPVEEK